MTNGINGDDLISFIERIEKLSEEKAGLASDIKSVFDEARGTGFAPKIMRRVIAIRKQDTAAREAFEEVLALYMEAIGMLAGTPLGGAAVKRVIKGIGTLTELTEDEIAKGCIFAFIDKRGNRCTIGEGIEP